MNDPFLHILDTHEISNLSGSIGRPRFPQYQFILCTKGKGVLCSEVSTEEDIKADALIYIRKNTLFSLRSASDDFCLRQIAFNGSMAKTYPQYFGFKSVMAFHGTDDKIRDAFRKAYDMFGTSASDDAQMFALYELIGLCGERLMTERQRPVSYERFVFDAARDYVDMNIRNPKLDMSRFIADRGLTRSELDRILISICGKASDEFITYRRMEIAKSLILRQYYNDYKDCGYTDRHEFYEAFYQYIGKNPSEYLRVLYPEL